MLESYLMRRAHARIRSRQVRTSVSLAVLATIIVIGATGAEAQTKAYIASTTANTVTVIDTNTETILATIPVGAGPTRVAVARDGSRAYVSNKDSDSVSVVDTNSDTIAATIGVGDNPSTLAVTPNGKHVYVMIGSGAVQVIDPLLNTIVATIRVNGSGGGIAITPDGSRAYVASGPISVIDTATKRVVYSFFAGGANVTAVAISPDGSRAYFATNGTDIFGSGGGVVVLDTATNAVIRTIVLGVVPGQIALTPDGGRAYVGVRSVWVRYGVWSCVYTGPLCCGDRHDHEHNHRFHRPWSWQRQLDSAEHRGRNRRHPR